MAKAKSERHHWWPEGVSSFWKNAENLIHCLRSDGSDFTSSPKNIGVIGNGHHIKLSNDPNGQTPWDASFEKQFDRVDANFPHVINWLNSLQVSEPSSEKPLDARMHSKEVSDQQFNHLIECIVSLAVRGPKYREKGVALAELFRGPLLQPERNRLIGVNIQNGLKNAIRSIGGRGKILVLFSPEREFIFGDGFYHNLPVPVDNWHNPKICVPLTPSISIVFVRPMSYSPLPRLFTMCLSPNDVNELNEIIQIYSQSQIFYRSQRPDVSEHFTIGHHCEFDGSENFVEDLIHAIPGVKRRDRGYYIQIV